MFNKIIMQISTFENHKKNRKISVFLCSLPFIKHTKFLKIPDLMWKKDFKKTICQMIVSVLTFFKNH